ncbi:hypothetical protein H4R18_002727 [Coemansia javaensis]|uniref:Transmembrane protein 188 n=1 Tax=Coemansia javaensis TaxID=2761396 RepID=A0A9W8LJL6_9FUNG|nr:hypothetical protein H4R18_002727 [Coemansia javaensis]
MKPSPPNDAGGQRQPQQQSMHSPVYGAARMSPGAELLPGAELASLYTRQFAASKGGAPSIYHTALLASTETGGQTYTHGTTVLQCARGRGPVDPHVFRDWLIFEERLKQSHRRLQRKKRSYLAQILAFGILVLYFAWFGFFGTQQYRFACKLLSAGSAYCTYLIVTNRRFLQAVRYPAQCNRALHQFRLRFETTPLQVPGPPAAANDYDDDATPPPPVESQLSFFPTVPRQLRDGYLAFKATYYRKRDAAKKRMQDRLRRGSSSSGSSRHHRSDPAASPSFRTSERRIRPRALRFPPIHSGGGGGGGADSDHTSPERPPIAAAPARAPLFAAGQRPSALRPDAHAGPLDPARVPAAAAAAAAAAPEPPGHGSSSSSSSESEAPGP